MSVLHANYARGVIRGGERQLILLVEELARRGVAQSVICRPGSGLGKALSQTPNVRLLRGRIHFADWMLYGRASILHAHEARAAYWAGLRGNLVGTPYLITRRVLNPLSEFNLTKMLYRNAAAIVGVSEAVCDLSRKEVGRPCVRIYDAHQHLVPQPQDVARIRSGVGGNPIIGQVAALADARKGQSATIAAFQLIKDRFPDARLVLLGSGPDEARLKQLAEKSDSILFPGYQDDIANWIAAFDVILHPSTRGALESSLLDAMHLGVPIVANRVGGIPEIARHGETALLVDLGDIAGLAASAIQLLTNPELRASIKAGGENFAKCFSPSAMADAYLELYENILRTRECNDAPS